MIDLKRTIRMDGGKSEGSTFDFRMVLATGGEASDGHVLNIAGGTLPERMPLLVSHWNDPEAQAGSIVGARKDLKASPPEVLAVGQVELEGEGSRADDRRDLAHMIGAGHVSAVSIRWEGEKVTPRRNLPSDHPAFIPDDDPDLAKRYGLYFEKWRALEGSIVAIGADEKAKIAIRTRAADHGTTGRWEAFLRSSEEPTPLEPIIRVSNLLGLGLELAGELSIPVADLRQELGLHFPDLFKPEETPGSEPAEARTEPPPDLEAGPGSEDGPTVDAFGVDDLAELFQENRTRTARDVGDMIATALGKVTR